MKISFNQHKLWQWLERELVAVLALGIVGLGSMWTLAGTTGTATLNVTVLPAGGETITVTAPNGGESWTIDTSQNITWTASGSIANVMIELQRTVAGAWETIVASTTNDGTYPWVVSGTATTTATIRISKVGDASVNDTSDAVFSIVASTPTPGGGGGSGSFIQYPMIDNVTPAKFTNQVDTVLRIEGRNFFYNSTFYLNSRGIPVTYYKGETYVEITVPAGMPVGQYSLRVKNANNIETVWGRLIEITKPAEFYAAKLVRQSQTSLDLKEGQTATVWVEYENTGTLSWTNYGRNPVRLGTSDPRDRRSSFRYGWVLFNRPAKVMLNGVSSSRSVVAPGQIGRFTFKVRAPRGAGNYIERFEPVVEFKQWMSGSAKLEIKVVSSKPASGGTVSKPSGASGGSILPTPNLPQPPAEFYDGIEKWLRSFTNFFGRLIGGVGKI